MNMDGSKITSFAASYEIK